MIYLDTSVLVAALTREPRTEEIQAWLADRNAGELFISDWAIVEFSSALSLKLRAGHLEGHHRADALATFNGLVENSFTVLPVSRRDYHTAARFADQHITRLRGGDALHLAVSSRHGARLRTLDRLLAQAASHLGVSAELL